MNNIKSRMKDIKDNDKKKWDRKHSRPVDKDQDNATIIDMEEVLIPYYQAYNKVMDRLKRLKNWGTACDCNTDEVESEHFYTDDGDDGLVSTYCVICGGKVDRW